MYTRPDAPDKSECFAVPGRSRPSGLTVSPHVPWHMQST